MALGNKLDIYLNLERAMFELDETGDPFADRIRNAMDPLWYSLSDVEHEYLDKRPSPFIR